MSKVTLILKEIREELVNLGLLMDTKSLKSYRLNLRANARALWAGEWDEFDFFMQMLTTIRRGLTQAAQEGAALCGIKPQEMSEEELQALEKQIVSENSHLDGLADFITANSRANGGKLEKVYKRVDLWANAYPQTKAMIQVMACGDKKYKWVISPVENCPSCRRLSGKCKRASFWRKHGVYPKAWDKLRCRNHCKCRLEPTDDPLTPGPLPNLP